MEVKIYADVVFAVNFIMDLLILWSVSVLARKKAKALRLFFGAAAAAFFYCLIIFLPPLYKFYNFFGSFVILCISILIVFGRQKPKEFIKLLFLIHLSAFGIGGAGTALFYFTGTSGVFGEGIRLFSGQFSFKLLIAFSAGIYILIKLFQGFISANITNRKDFCRLEVDMSGRKTEITALIDTGNSLEDPLTGKAVAIAELSAVADVFPPTVQIILYENMPLEKTAEALKDTEVFERLRIIPFSSLGKNKGMLLGFRFDEIKIYRENNSEEITLKNSVMGISYGVISKTSGYQALISPEFLKGDQTHKGEARHDKGKIYFV